MVLEPRYIHYSVANHILDLVLLKMVVRNDIKKSFGYILSINMNDD